MFRSKQSAVVLYSNMIKKPACFLCLDTYNLKRCSLCGEYMCERHSYVHYGDDGQCYPFRVEFRNELGRILVATRKIKKGELICVETPAIVGPYSRSPPQCLQCFRRFATDHEVVCQGCGFPVCSNDCSNGKYHAEECEILARIGLNNTSMDMEELNPNYSAISVLRLLLLLERERKAVEVGSNMSGEDYLLCLASSLLDHNQERRLAQPHVWQFEEEFMVEFLQKTCQLGERFSREEIHAANGRIMMNATSLELPDGCGRGAGLFPIYSMMNTSCKNNTKSRVMPDHRVEIRAKTRIREGEEITNEYLKPETGTLLRREVINTKWFFYCSCPRCRDPTELGSHYSSLLCPVRRCGGPMVSTDPLDHQSDWGCQECLYRLPVTAVRDVLRESREYQDSPGGQDGVIEFLENVIFNLSQRLHPGHFLVMEAKQKLGLLYGNIYPHTSNRLSRPAWQRKAQLCSEALSSLSRLESGLSEWRIVLMTELAKTQDPACHKDNPDPDGRRGMMAKFLLQDGMLSLTNCLQLCDS